MWIVPPAWFKQVGLRNGMSLTMAGLYRISATPVLHSAGAFQGKLKGISFTAVSSLESNEWYSNNCGHFELAFSKIMPTVRAEAIVARLMHGDEVEFPGLYAVEQFENGFVYEWPCVPPDVSHFLLGGEFRLQCGN
jgi:hypothetical protein